MEQLRTLVSVHGWECCVVWRVSKDQRFIEWLDCCCAGAENLPQEPTFAASQCRDSVILHSRTKACDLLAQFPPFMLIEDSGVYAETLISNQPRWLHLSQSSTSADMPQFATRLLIPVPGGLIELFAARPVSENQHIIDCIAEYSKLPPEKEANSISSTDMTAFYNEISLFGPKFETTNSTDIFFDEFMNQLYNSSVKDGLLQGMDSMLVSDVSNTGVPVKGSGNDRGQQGHDVMEAAGNIEMGRSDSISDCSDQLDEDDADAIYRKKSGKGPQSKNLIAERKRRKKLNERLYKLRSLVPKISKLDRASILGDAIDFLKELQKQKKDLEDELQQQQSDDEYHHEDTNPFLGQTEDTMDQDQLEAQVEVSKIDGGDALFIKLLCENKPGSFVGVLEALDHLGLEVTNVNINTHETFVSNVLLVQGKEGSCVMVEADSVKDSLLSTTRNSIPTGSLRRPNLAARQQ
uniref:BHLH domain-containing protein n=1 Tax=Kalanchoe fedtschenkoi TaxID=63787 RepID=A0A7N1A5S9_KALFE